jgi:hypothetical protein
MQTSPDGAPPTLVVLRPLGSPLGLGLSGLAVASLVTGGLALGWVQTSKASQVGLIVPVTVVPLHAAWATELEETTETGLTATGRRGPGRIATSAAYPTQVVGVEHEAGVRRQL